MPPHYSQPWGWAASFHKVPICRVGFEQSAGSCCLSAWRTIKQVSSFYLNCWTEMAGVESYVTVVQPHSILENQTFLMSLMEPLRHFCTCLLPVTRVAPRAATSKLFCWHHNCSLEVRRKRQYKNLLGITPYICTQICLKKKQILFKSNWIFNFLIVVCFALIVFFFFFSMQT